MGIKPKAPSIRREQAQQAEHTSWLDLGSIIRVYDKEGTKVRGDRGRKLTNRKRSRNHITARDRGKSRFRGLEIKSQEVWGEACGGGVRVKREL